MNTLLLFILFIYDYYLLLLLCPLSSPVLMSTRLKLEVYYLSIKYYVQ